MSTPSISRSPKLRPKGITALSAFFVFGTLMSSLAAISLLLPGSILEPIWRVNPRAHETFSTMRLWAPLLLAAVCVVCALAAYGLFYGRLWGYRLAIALLVTNLMGDIANVVLGIEPLAWIGVPIVLLLIWYLRSPTVRGHFRQLSQ